MTIVLKTEKYFIGRNSCLLWPLYKAWWHCLNATILRILIGQYCRIQLCHWLKLYSSQLYSSDYLFICHVFEQSAWHYPYVLDLYVSMPFSVVIQFTRQWPDLRHWDKSRMKRRGEECRMRPPGIPGPLSSCLSHNQILPQQWPGHWGAPRMGWDMLRPMRHHWPG